MPKHAIIFHGTDGNPNAIWYRWLAENLRSREFDVDVPHYPDINKVSIDTFLPSVLLAHQFTKDTVLIGHSGGAALLLAILESLEKPVSSTFLVAGYSSQPNEEKEPVLKPTYDWEAIRENGGDVYIINSIIDPYGCDAAQGKLIFDKIGGTQIVMNEGHFGDWNQEYPTFPLLARLIH